MRRTILYLVFMLVMIGCRQPDTTKTENSGIVYKDPGQSVEARVVDLLSRMNLDEKIGQMTQVDRRFLKTVEDIQKYYLGSLLSGGGSSPEPNTADNWAVMIKGYQEQALKTRLSVPLLYGVDAVHGHNNVYGAVIFPHNIGMGCTRNPALVEQAARITALELAGTGVNWNFAPCVAVPRDERWGRTYEGFGEVPDLVRNLGDASVKGLQGAIFSDNGSVIACAKHYIGDGGTTGGIDRGNTEIDQNELFEIHLPGYIGAIENNVGSVMISYSSWNGQKMHGHAYLINTVLKGELGFDGIVISDWTAIDQLPGDYKNDILTSITAGLDMIMVPERYEEFITDLKALVNEGAIPMERIDDAVSRILRIKFKFGLFEKPFVDKGYTAEIGSESHRQLSRKCVQQSLVLLKNEERILPLDKSLSRIHVAGANADDLGNQCGGWTITWQGTSGNITVGTTILEAIKNTVSETTTVSYTRNGTGAEGADVGIVVVGETPYAEQAGDRTDLGLSEEDIAAIQNIKNTGIPVIIILVSGRPMIIEPILDSCDAFIAAWLPGTEGQGVADIVFGDVAPSGKLSHSWPKNMGQIPINYGDNDYNPLFPYGYGLTYE